MMILTMHPLRNALAAPLLIPCILMAAAPPRVERWDAARSPWRVPPVWRGETVGLECAMPGADLDGAEASFLWQTNGMAGWWSAPAAATNGAVSAVWTPAMDCGAAEYRFFLRAETAGGVAYRANGTLAVLGSPGEDPVVLAPPFPTLDLSAVEVLNAPWATPGDVDEAIRAAQIAGADLSAYATWQGLDAATNAVRENVEWIASSIVGHTDEATNCVWRGTLLSPEYGPWSIAPPAIDGRPLAVEVNVRGGGYYLKIWDAEWGIYVPCGAFVDPGDAVELAVETTAGPAVTVSHRLVGYRLGDQVGKTLASAPHVSDAIAAATNGLLSAETELEAIRAAAASIALPADPTAAEIGAALTNLISIIAGPQEP